MWVRVPPSPPRRTPVRGFFYKGSVTIINTYNEYSLHAKLKEYYRQEGDILEQKMHGYIIDLVRGDTLVEIQTGNFSAIRKKLIHLVQREKVLLVYPIPKEKILITEISDEKETKRKSPRKGDIWMLFKELIRIPEIINHPNLSIEAVFVKIEEIKRKDGKGSWRRKGDSILDRRLLQVFNRKRFEEPVDFLDVLPKGLSTNFSCRDLSKKADIDIGTARKAVYCLKKMNALDVAFKIGNELYYIISQEVFTQESPF